MPLLSIRTKQAYPSGLLPAQCMALMALGTQLNSTSKVITSPNVLCKRMYLTIKTVFLNHQSCLSTSNFIARQSVNLAVDAKHICNEVTPGERTRKRGVEFHFILFLELP